MFVIIIIFVTRLIAGFTNSIIILLNHSGELLKVGGFFTQLLLLATGPRGIS